MAGYQNTQRTYGDQDQQRDSVPELKLTQEQLIELSAMTKRDGFLAFDPVEIDMILDLCRAAYLPDFKRFVYRASGLGLNPLHNEIHMEYKWSKGKAKATFVVHIDGMRKMADRTGKRGGFAQKIGHDERGEFVESTVWRNDCANPFTSRVYFQEFMQTGEYSLYKSKPYHMVAKCGEAFAYKQAFPVSGMTTDDEIDAWPTDQGPQRLDRDVQAPAAPEPPQVGSGLYVVAEKTPETTASDPAPVPAPPQAAPPPQAKPATQPTPAPQTTAAPPSKPVPPQKAMADRLKAKGLTNEDLSDYARFFFDPPIAAGTKMTPDQYVAAFSAAEEWLQSNTVDQLRAGIAKCKADEAKPAEEPTSDVFTSDPAVMEAVKQVSAKWPMWGTELSRVAALWCADQVKDASALDAFLISCGITGQTPPGRIEALLAITRHMALSAGLAVIEYSKKSNNPLSMIEADLSKSLGQSIRFALDLRQNDVANAFNVMASKGKV